MGRRGGDPPGQTPAGWGGGGVAGACWWQPEFPGKKRGEAAPPSAKGVMMFELARLNVFTPDIKEGGALAVHLHVLASDGTGGYGVCWEYVGVLESLSS